MAKIPSMYQQGKSEKPTLVKGTINQAKSQGTVDSSKRGSAPTSKIPKPFKGQ